MTESNSFHLLRTSCSERPRLLSGPLSAAARTSAQTSRTTNAVPGASASSPCRTAVVVAPRADITRTAVPTLASATAQSCAPSGLTLGNQSSSNTCTAERRAGVDSIQKRSRANGYAGSETLPGDSPEYKARQSTASPRTQRSARRPASSVSRDTGGSAVVTGASVRSNSASRKASSSNERATNAARTLNASRPTCRV